MLAERSDPRQAEKGLRGPHILQPASERHGNSRREGAKVTPSAAPAGIRESMDDTHTPSAALGLIGRAVPFMFGLIGLTVCVFLWAAPFGEWDSPPLFFRVFGTLIASVFMIVGFGSAIAGPKMMSGVRSLAKRGRAQRGGSEPARVGYECPNCGSSLQSGADVSPSGDVKCTFCDRWFNIHQAGR